MTKTITKASHLMPVVRANMDQEVVLEETVPSMEEFQRTMQEVRLLMMLERHQELLTILQHTSQILAVKLLALQTGENRAEIQDLTKVLKVLMAMLTGATTNNPRTLTIKVSVETQEVGVREEDTLQEGSKLSLRMNSRVAGELMYLI